VTAISFSIYHFLILLVILQGLFLSAIFLFNKKLAEITFFLHAFFEKFEVKTTGQVPQMKPLLTLQPDQIILKMKRR